MMSQENYVSINDLHKQGWTILEIPEATGWHRTTVSNYLKNSPPPATRPTEASVMTEHWQARIKSMLESWPRMQSVSIHNKARCDRLRRFVSDGRACCARHSRAEGLGRKGAPVGPP